MAILDSGLLALLKSKGYTGGDTIEEVLIPIAQYLQQRGMWKTNGVEWWITAKDIGMAKGINFQQAMVNKYIELFK